MFPCRHRGEMFAMQSLCLPVSPQSHQLAVQCPEPVSAGERTGGREALTYTQKMKEKPQMSCVSPGAKRPHLTQPCPVEKRSLLFLGCSVDARGTRLVSLEARLNVRAAMEAADLTTLPQTQDGDGSAFIELVHSGLWNRHVDICFGLVWPHFSMQQNIFTSSIHHTSSERKIHHTGISVIHSH